MEKLLIILIQQQCVATQSSEFNTVEIIVYFYCLKSTLIRSIHFQVRYDTWVHLAALINSQSKSK